MKINLDACCQAWLNTKRAKEDMKKKPMTVSEMARLGGYGRAKKMSKRDRADSARYAAVMRWSNNNQKKGKAR